MKKVYVIKNGRVLSLKEGVNVPEYLERMRAQGHTVALCTSPPTLPTCKKYAREGVARATDGCKVEPDGTCPHGCSSWLLLLGVI